jgi:hypothetical protein
VDPGPAAGALGKLAGHRLEMSRPLWRSQTRRKSSARRLCGVQNPNNS